MTAEIHTARCLCGKITLEATGPAKYMEYCHCKWCQQVSGSAFLPLIVFDRNNVEITSGALSYFQSSPNNQRGFCPDCGSTICFSSPRSFDIALGIMDSPENFKAIRHIWTKSQISHIKIVDDLPKFEESGP